jgi:hypothetical protein
MPSHPERVRRNQPEVNEPKEWPGWARCVLTNPTPRLFLNVPVHRVIPCHGCGRSWTYTFPDDATADAFTLSDCPKCSTHGVDCDCPPCRVEACMARMNRWYMDPDPAILASGR